MMHADATATCMPPSHRHRPVPTAPDDRRARVGVDRGDAVYSNVADVNVTLDIRLPMACAARNLCEMTAGPAADDPSITARQAIYTVCY